MAKMWRLPALLLPLLFLVQTVYPIYVPYSCRRYNQACGPPLNRGVCLLSGDCQCPPNFQGFDCQLPSASVVPSGLCNVNCNGRGICYDDGSPTHNCYCDAAYFGDTCQFDRVSVQCAENNMTVRVFPQSFDGIAYVRNIPPSVNTACQLLDAADGNGLTRTLSFDQDRTRNPCSPALSVSNNSDGTQVFTFEIIVLYNADYTSKFDEIHTITCDHTLGGPLVGTVVGIGGFPTDGISITGNTTVVEFDVTRNGISVADNGAVVVIGDDLVLEARLTSNRYDSHRVENCGAYNVPIEPAVNPARKEKTIVTDGCPANKSLDVIRGPISKSGRTISIPIRAFKFNTGELYFYCSVRVCERAGDPLCLPTDCSMQNGGPGTGFGRRKKRQSGDEAEIIDVKGTIFILPVAPSTPEPPAQTSVVEESCLESPAFLAITGVFVVLLLTVLIITAFLVTRYVKREKELKGKYSDES